MPFPAGVTTRDVSFGQAFTMEGGTSLTMRVTVEASRTLVHRPTGSPLVAAKTQFLSEVSGNGTVSLPVTDSDDMGTGDGQPIVLGAGEHTHHYSAKIEYLDADTQKPLPGVASRTIGVFTLPTGDGTTADLDDLYAPLTPTTPVTLSLLDQYRAVRDQTIAARIAAEAAVTAAEAAVTAAEQVRDETTEISGIDTVDEVIDDALDAYSGKARGGGLREFGRRAGLAAGGTATHLPWVFFGDSMSHMKWFELRKYVLRMFGGGYAGHVLESLTNNATTAGVTTTSTDYARWVTGTTTTIPAGDSRTYGAGGGSFICDRVKVYYFNTGGGTFKVQVDGVDAAGHTNVSTSGAAGSLSIITIDLTHGPHTVKVVGLTGSVTILGAAMLDRTRSGIVGAPLGRGGLELADGLTTQAVANLRTFLTDLNPAVFTYEMREADYSNLPARLATLFDAVTETTAADLIGFGVPWDGRTGNAATPAISFPDWVMVTNRYLRDAVEARAGYYWDGNTITPDWQTISDLGWGADPIHPAQGLSALYVPFILRDLGILRSDAAYPFDVFGTKVRADTLDVQREQDPTPALRARPEPSFGFDADLIVGRWLAIWNATRTTKYMQLDPGGNGQHYMPNDWRIGSLTGPRFNATGDSVTVVGNDNKAAPFTVSVLSLVDPDDGASSTKAYGGTGVPTHTADAGAFYFRKDTPTVANQRIYVNVSGTGWVGIL